MADDMEYFERIPSNKELEELAGEEFIIKLRQIPDVHKSKWFEGIFNAHLFFELPFVPNDDEFESFRSIPHAIAGVNIFVDHSLTDGELRMLILLQRFVEDYNLHVHVMTTYVPGYEERRRVKGLRFLPQYNFLLSAVPNFEVRGDLLKILPSPNVLLLLDHVPRDDELVECRRTRPTPCIGIMLDHFLVEAEYLRLRDEVGCANTIVYFNIGRDLKNDEIEYMKRSGVPFTTVTDRDDAVLNLLSL